MLGVCFGFVSYPMIIPINKFIQLFVEDDFCHLGNVKNRCGSWDMVLTSITPCLIDCVSEKLKKKIANQVLKSHNYIERKGPEISWVLTVFWV